MGKALKAALGRKEWGQVTTKQSSYSGPRRPLFGCIFSHQKTMENFLRTELEGLREARILWMNYRPPIEIITGIDEEELRKDR